MQIDRSYTLFLDRDGVINQRIIGGYVTRLEDFIFIDGVLNSIEKFSSLFGKIIVVTNQQGIGKGLMTEDDLSKVHRFMVSEIENSGGRIDAVYHAPHLAMENHPDRKPSVGMGLRAKKDFPSINFSKSVMVGDSVSDMEFGQKLGMKCLFIGKNKNQKHCFKNLNEVAEFFK